jgi:hypothetical protein
MHFALVQCNLFSLCQAPCVATRNVALTVRLCRQLPTFFHRLACADLHVLCMHQCGNIEPCNPFSPLCCASSGLHPPLTLPSVPGSSRVQPIGAPVSERAIPTAIFSADETTKRHYLKQWLKDPGMTDFDIRDVVDWEYYITRVSG